MVAHSNDIYLKTLLASEDVLKSFSSTKEKLRITFSVSRIKCSACAWKIESFLQNQSHCSDWHIDIPNSTLTLTLSHWTDVAAMVKQMSTLGFDSVPINNHADLQMTQNKDYQQELFRLIVAAFCAGNIMSLSLSNYFGATGHFRFWFDVISLVLALPALFYSAYPYYRGFWTTLKTGVPSLDFPIALALFGGTLLSALNLFSGTGDVYFDSITGLILLLLVSRFFLNRMTERLLRTGNLDLPGIDFVREIENGVEKVIPAKQLVEGKLYSVQPGETVPCDGILVNDSAQLSTAVITGEPYTQVFLKDSALVAGSVVIGSPILLRSTSTVATSRFGKLLASLANNDFRKLPHAHIVNTWAMWFSYAVLATGIGVFIYWWPIDPRIGLNRVLALFMTSCPCALTFGFPLIMSLSLRQAQRSGVLIQDISVFSKLNHITDVYFDKTGTLTSEELDIITPLKTFFDNEDLLAIYALEEKSHHPIAQALKKNLQADFNHLPEVTDFKYTPTVGISGTVHSQHYAIKSIASKTGTLSVLVFKNDVSIGSIEFQEHIRDSAISTVESLKQKGLNVHLLSGDAQSTVLSVAKTLQINGTVLGGQTPEQKQKLIQKQSQHSLMIGDGINDAASLSAAAVGVSMPGSIEKLNSVAQIILSKPKLEALPLLFDLSRFTTKATRRLAYLSFAYNLIISTLALLGHIHPLIAAILMPASSMAVILLVLFTKKEMQWKSLSY